MLTAWIAGFMACQLAVTANAAPREAFAIRPGNRVVFYGDSITEQRYYTRWVELFVSTRFPTLHAQFWTAGVGGDRVVGGSGGRVDTRLARDVFAFQPDMVTVMLGMNDGGYSPLTPETEAEYRRGYAHILDSVAQHLPHARITCIAPSPYDEIVRMQPLFPGGYNNVLLRFGAIDREFTQRSNLIFADANAPFTQALTDIGPGRNLAGRMLVPDRVHPAYAAHLLIAAAILRAWNAPAIVSDTQLDVGLHPAIKNTTNVRILDLTGDRAELSWSSLEQALPFPIDLNDAAVGFVAELGNLEQEFNRELLQVSGLAPGNYELRIDEKRIGMFTAEQLAGGLNLAEFDTPMREQAQRLDWAIRDRQDVGYVRLRMKILGADAASIASLDAPEAMLQKQIWADSIPTEHRFDLTKVSNSSAPDSSGRQ